MRALPEAEAALGETAVAASAAELMAAVRKKSLLVLNSYFLQSFAARWTISVRNPLNPAV
jgi:hypothetical protein